MATKVISILLAFCAVMCWMSCDSKLTSVVDFNDNRIYQIGLTTEGQLYAVSDRFYWVGSPHDFKGSAETVPYHALLYADSSLIYYVDTTEIRCVARLADGTTWSHATKKDRAYYPVSRQGNWLVTHLQDHWLRAVQTGQPLLKQTVMRGGPYAYGDQWLLLDSRLASDQSTLYWELLRQHDSMPEPEIVVDGLPVLVHTLRLSHIDADHSSLLYEEDPRGHVDQSWFFVQLNKRDLSFEDALLLPLFEREQYATATPIVKKWNENYFACLPRTTALFWIKSDLQRWQRIAVTDPIQALWPASDSTLYYVAGRQLVEANPYTRTQTVRYEHRHDLLAGATQGADFYFVEKEYAAPDIHNRLCRVRLERQP